MARRHHLSSWLRSVTSMPGMTMNLQESISRGLSSSGSWQDDPAILAILIPAEAAVRNRFRADELEAAQQRIALGHLEFLAHDGDVDELFVRTKGFRHDLTYPLQTVRSKLPRGDGSHAASSE